MLFLSLFVVVVVVDDDDDDDDDVASAGFWGFWTMMAQYALPSIQKTHLSAIHRAKAFWHVTVVDLKNATRFRIKYAF